MILKTFTLYLLSKKKNKNFHFDSFTIHHPNTIQLHVHMNVVYKYGVENWVEVGRGCYNKYNKKIF